MTASSSQCSTSAAAYRPATATAFRRLCAYGAVIRRSLRRHFGNRLPEVIIEPGRQMVGDAGIIQTEVVLIADREDADATALGLS